MKQDGCTKEEKKVAYCTVCCACRDTGNCAIKDDMADIIDLLVTQNTLQ